MAPLIDSIDVDTICGILVFAAILCFIVSVFLFIFSVYSLMHGLL